MSTLKKQALFNLILVLALMIFSVRSVQAAGSPTGNKKIDHLSGLASITATDTIKIPGDFSNLQNAINQVSDGGIIEISSGTYNSPPSGFNLSNLNKSFTIQAAPGANVVLNGRDSNYILSSHNVSPDQAGFIVIKGIIFANGYAHQDGVGVVTLYATNATFIDVEFRKNYKSSSPGRTVGAAVNIADNSTVFFTNCKWVDNTSQDGGAGLGIRELGCIHP